MQKISIITPVYDVESDIKDCIDSIINQNYQDWELILVDDCSPDSCGAICDSYALKDDRIRVIHHETRQGAAKARRTGVEAARGEFVGFVDADDLIETDMYSTLVQHIEALSVDVMMCSYFINTKNGQRAIENSGTTTLFTAHDALGRLHIMNGEVSRHLVDKLFRRSVLANYDADREIVVGEDYSLLVKTFEKCEKLGYIGVPLYHYRQRAKSVCNAGYTEKRWLCIENYKRFKAELSGKYPDLSDVVCNYCLMEEMAVMVSMTKNGNYDNDVIRRIAGDVRKGCKTLLTGSEVPFSMRLSAVLVFISPKLLLLLGKLRYSVQKNELY